MPQLKVLICGAGIAGNALAYWLSRLGHDITVVERYPTLRDSGLQLDLRGSGIKVMRRMGLEKAFRAKSVPEQGLQLIDKSGKQWGKFASGETGNESMLSFTSEIEIMRTDMCHILHGGTKDRAKYVFGTYVQEFTQTDDYAEVLFSNGSTERFDLVVGADGQGSRLRRMMLDADAPDPVHYLGMCIGYFTINQPIEKGEGYNASMFITTDKRSIMTRRHNASTVQVYLKCDPDFSTRLKNSSKGDTDEEKEGLAEIFRGAGWQTKEVLKGLYDADDFYYERMIVVKLDSWSRNRVTLVGDAAYCPSSMTGMGTTCGLVGAYILAGEIGKHCGRGSKEPGEDPTVPKDNIATALKKYDENFRPYMDDVQKGLTDGTHYRFLFPTGQMGISVVYYLFWIVSLLRLDVIANWAVSDNVKGWELPDYEELQNLHLE